MTAASWITMARIAMIPAFMFFALQPGQGSAIAACVLFSVSALTDMADGYVARKYHQVTSFGKFIDPLADKLLVTAALVVFAYQGKMPVWAVMLVLSREFAVTSLRMVGAAQGKVIAADWAGKIKMWVQCVGIAVLLTDARLADPLGGFPLGDAVVWLMAAVTLWSGVHYLVKNKDTLREG
jgi:CDP-diacylglycerol--glycerol-3-phosphate 3-phosphatidyltransferase